MFNKLLSYLMFPNLFYSQEPFDYLRMHMNLCQAQKIAVETQKAREVILLII